MKATLQHVGKSYSSSTGNVVCFGIQILCEFLRWSNQVLFLLVNIRNIFQILQIFSRYSDGQGIVQSRHHRHHVCISEGMEWNTWIRPLEFL